MSGIDGIGKRGGAGGVIGPADGTSAPDAPKTTEPTTSFREVAATRAAQATQATADVTGSAPLDQLRAGTIDVNGYLDRKVDEATHALHGLPKHELDVIRHTLRQQLSTDPGLIELVQKATGALPPSPTGEGE